MSRKFRAEQHVHIHGWECGTEIELKIVARFSMTPHIRASLDGPEELPQPLDTQIEFFRRVGRELKPVVLPPWIEDEFIDSTSFQDWLSREAEDQMLADAEYAAEARAEDMRERGDA